MGWDRVQGLDSLDRLLAIEDKAKQGAQQALDVGRRRVARDT